MKWILLITLFLVCSRGVSQNLVGGSIEEIKKELLPTPWVLSKESLNKGFKHYLVYIAKDHNYTQGYYFNDLKICDEYRIVSKMSNVVKFVDEVNSIFIKTSKNTWKSKDSNMLVDLELDHEKDLFTLSFYTPRSQ